MYMYLSGGEWPGVNELVGFINPTVVDTRRTTVQPGGGRVVMGDELNQVIKSAWKE